MNVRISALFDSPDSADIALMNLRSNGIAFQNVSLRESGRNAHVENDRAENYYIPAFGMSGTGGSGMMNVFAAGFYPAAVAGLNDDGDRPSDVYSGESKLEIDVDESSADKTKQIIISSHGHRITS